MGRTGRNWYGATSIALAVSAIIVVGAPNTALAATFTVNSTSDAADILPGDGLCQTIVGGECTLRAAITEANVASSSDTISFSIAGAGVQTIAPATPLPSIQFPTTINGYSQPGSSANTLAVGNDANLLIEINGAAISSSTGIDILGSAAGSQVRGLVINRFGGGGTAVVAGPSTVVAGNFIGSNPAGTAASGNTFGVLSDGSSGVVVGGPAPADRNLFADNSTAVVVRGDADDNRIVGNYIGTDRNGTAALPNGGGIVTETPSGAGPTNLIIGGANPGEGNLVSGQFGTGIVLNGNQDGTLIYGNLVGTDVTGTLPIPNSVGIQVGIGAGNINGTQIGGPAPGQRNVVSGNTVEGISVWNQDTVGTVIRGNYIGVATDGTSPLSNNPSLDPNAYGGIVVRNFSRDTVIGGNDPGDGNVIAFNSDGIVDFSGRTRIVGNSIANNFRRGIFLPSSVYNDPGDVDSGFVGNLQNFPVIRTATIDGGGDLIVEFSIDSLLTSSSYPIQIDFYAKGDDNEGAQFIGRTTVPSPGINALSFGSAAAIPIVSTDYLTATATDALGNTSNFSPLAFVDDPQRLTPSVANEAFGQALDVDGNRLAVAAPFAFVDGEVAGLVRIYDRSDTSSPWVLSGTVALPPAFQEGNDGFGDAIALSGDRLAVGESAKFSGVDQPGRVWVFERQGNGTWAQLGGPILRPGGGARDEFGASLAWVSDGRLVVGSPQANAVYLAQYSGSVWDVAAAGTAGLPIDFGDQLGYSVAVDDRPGGGYRLVAGAPGNDVGSTNGGAVAIFEDTGSGFNWTRFFNGYSPASGQTGTAVDLDGDRFVLGSHGDDPTDPVIAFIYDFDGTNWLDNAVQVTNTTSWPLFANDYLALEADTIALGQPSGAGRVNLFRYDGSAWAPAPAYTHTFPSAGDEFGQAIELDGGTLVAGAASDDGPGGIMADGGAVYTTTVAGPVATPPGLTFGLDLATGSPDTVSVSPSGFAVSQLDRNAVARNGGGSANVAASSISTIGPEDTSLASITLGSTGIAAIVLGSTPLKAIPLVNIEVDGGWPAILAGSDLVNVPLSDLTFGRALETGDAGDPNSVAGRLAATPLKAITVGGTPLKAIPIAALALGSTPLKAIPLKAIDPDVNPWCALIAPLLQQGQSCTAALDSLSLLEVTLRGVSIDAAQLNAIPLKAIDVSLSPLKAIPLKAIALGSTPLGAIPLKAIDVTDSPLKAIPLKAIPLKAIPLSAIDLTQAPAGTPLLAIALNASPLEAIGTSFPVAATTLTAIGSAGTPLSAIRLEGVPLGAIPLGAIMLADTPLGAIALSEGGVALDWCDVLDESTAPFNCDSGVDLATTTLSDLSIRGVPLESLPLKAIDLDAAPLGAIPLKAIPLGAIPLKAIPLGAISLSTSPLGAIPVAGTPLKAIPLKAIDLQGSPLGAIPLKAIPLGAIPLGSIPLKAIPLKAIPLKAIPLGAITVGAVPLGAIPLKAIDIAGSPLKAIPLKAIPAGAIELDCALVDCVNGTLGDAWKANAILGEPVLSDIQTATAGVGLGELIGAVPGLDANSLAAALDSAALSLNALTLLDELTLGDLPFNLPALADVTLGQVDDGLSQVTLADLAAALRDPATGRPVPGIEGQLLAALSSLNQTVGDFARIGNITLADVLGGSAQVTIGDVLPVLRFISVDTLQQALNVTITIDPSIELGDLTPQQRGQLTLADLAQLADTDGGDITLQQLLGDLNLAGELEGYTVADLLLGLVDRASLALGGTRFTNVDVGALPPGILPPSTFTASLSLSGSTRRTVEFELDLPSSASYIAGSSSITQGGTSTPLEPDVVGSTLRWSFIAEPGDDYAIDLDVLPALRLGSTTLEGTASVVGTDVVIPATASVTVAEGAEPNDFPPTTLAAEDTVYLNYVSSPTDNDVYRIVVAENDRLVIELSNLDADLDVALWAKPLAGSATPPLSRTSADAPLFPIVDPDAAADTAEPLNDFRRLDAIDASLSLVATANKPGTKTEQLVTERLAAGTYYVQVYGANGATNVQPAALQLKILEADQRPACQARPPLNPLATAGSAPTLASLNAADTLILINEQRLEQLYGATARANVVAATGRLVAYLAANPDLGIKPVVVPVDGYSSVRSAYTAWDASPCDPATSNAVVSAINSSIIDPVRSRLDHVVILGGDEVIPMARLTDGTQIANEYDYRHEFDGLLAYGDPDGRNAFTAPLWESMIRSDDPYGESAARSLGDRSLYVPDLALGRLVETPAEIIEALDTFAEYGGSLDIQSANVLGYDFLSDGSARVADELAAGGLAVDDELADGTTALGEKWDEADATAELIDAGNKALVSLNAHFDHYRALPAVGDQVPGFDDNLIADTLADQLGPDALAQSLIFSMGCHSGLSVADIAVGTTNIDWAQTLSQQDALFVGNTGFGYGDTKTVAYTERLMALFADQLTSPVNLPEGTGVAPSTVGQALTWAKNAYFADGQTFSVYDEKALMESTFYGLPFYRVGRPATALPPAPTTQPAPDATGTPAVQLTVSPLNEAVVDPELGTYYRNLDPEGVEQVIVAPGRPIQPSTTRDVSVVAAATPRALSQIAHGALVLDMTSTYGALPDPVIATPVFDESDGQPEPDVGEGVFPTKQLDITSITGPAGQRQQLVLATGQYDSSSAVQRLDTDLDVSVYYDSPTETDFVPPTIGEVRATVTDDIVSVSLSATDAAGVDRVYLLLAENPGAGVVDWVGVDLTKQTGTDRWTGSLALRADTDVVEFIVQAKDTNGNVGYATDKAANFGTSTAQPPALPPPPPEALTTAVTSANPPQAGWYDGPVSVTIDAAASDASYTVDGIDKGPISVGSSFEITGDGPHTWEVITAAGQRQAGSVKIDTDGAPRIALGAPANGGVYKSGSRTLDVICRDTSLSSCTSVINGTAYGNGDPLPTAPGNYTLTVTATDQLGNATTRNVGFRITAATGVPVIGSISGPTTPQNRTAGITVSAAFTNAATPFDTHTATINWGDGTTSAAAVVEPTLEASGTATGTHTYAEPGVYSISVTVKDNGNATDTELFEFAVVYDPTAGKVSGSGAYYSGPSARPGGSRWGTLALFGYEARYKPNATAPTGQTQLKLVGDLLFKSTAYQYLIVNDTLAVAEGVGTTGGGTQYRFRVQGIDNGWVDFFQLTIWNPTTGSILYDNGVLYDGGDLVLLGGIKIGT